MAAMAAIASAKAARKEVARSVLCAQAQLDACHEKRVVVLSQTCLFGVATGISGAP